MKSILKYTMKFNKKHTVKPNYTKANPILIKPRVYILTIST